MGNEARAPTHVPTPLAVATADEAIACVLQHEREAAQALLAAQEEAVRLNEAARARCRNLAQRTDRRLQAVVAAFDRQARERCAALTAQAAKAAQAHEIDDTERVRLVRAVQALAAQLTSSPGRGGP